MAVALLSFGLSVDLDARFRDFAWVFLASIVALGTSYVFTQIPGAHQVAPFLASLIVAVLIGRGITAFAAHRPGRATPPPRNQLKKGRSNLTKTR